MNVENIKKIYDGLYASIQILQAALDYSYTEALHETLQNILAGEAQQIDNAPSDEAVQQLNLIYQDLAITSCSPTEIQKGIQLAFLEGERKDSLPANQQMTPEAIAILMGYFAAELSKHQHFDRQTVRLFDPVIGSGNLWAIVARQLMDKGLQVEGEGYDNDDLMLSIAEKSLALQGLHPQLYLGDSLQNLMVQPAHIVVADLPVGYYPVDEVAARFSAGFESGGANGHSYAHFLLIEQSLRYLQANGWGIFLVPSNIFTSEGGMHLIKAIGDYGYFQAFLNLPGSLFQTVQSHKSILIVQKSGDKARQTAQVLLGNVPSLKDEQQMNRFLDDFQSWLKKLA